MEMGGLTGIKYDGSFSGAHHNFSARKNIQKNYYYYMAWDGKNI